MNTPPERITMVVDVIAKTPSGMMWIDARPEDLTKLKPEIQDALKDGLRLIFSDETLWKNGQRFWLEKLKALLPSQVAIKRKDDDPS